MSCIFCRIIKGEIPNYTIYEDDNILAFLDIAADAEGHTLVIPKAHYESIIDCPPEVLSSVTAAVQKICLHYTKCGFNGFNILNNNGASSGQEVGHLHIHIYPRRDNDKLHLLAKRAKQPLDLNEIKERLKLQ